MNRPHPAADLAIGIAVSAAGTVVAYLGVAAGVYLLGRKRIRRWLR